MVSEPRRGAASHRLATPAALNLLLGLVGVVAGVVVTEPGVQPDDPLPVCKEGFEWASAVSLQLAGQGVPMSVLEGDPDKVLSACVSAFQRQVPNIRRTSGVVELFSGTARIARSAACWCETWSFELEEHDWQDASFPQRRQLHRRLFRPKGSFQMRLTLHLCSS